MRFIFSLNQIILVNALVSLPHFCKFQKAFQRLLPTCRSRDYKILILDSIGHYTQPKHSDENVKKKKKNNAWLESLNSLSIGKQHLNWWLVADKAACQHSRAHEWMTILGVERMPACSSFCPRSLNTLLKGTWHFKVKEIIQTHPIAMGSGQGWQGLLWCCHRM